MNRDIDKLVEKIEKYLSLNASQSLTDNKRKIRQALIAADAISETVAGQLFKKNLVKLEKSKSTRELGSLYHRLMHVYVGYKQYGVHLDAYTGQNIPDVSEIATDKLPTERIERLLFLGLSSQIVAGVCQVTAPSVYAVRNRIKDAGYDIKNLDVQDFEEYKRKTIFK